jgi:hypothetical protein
MATGVSRSWNLVDRSALARAVGRQRLLDRPDQHVEGARQGTAQPHFTVLAGRQEIGRTDPMLLTEKTDGPRLLLLGGRSWKVTWTDWKRRRCYVEPAEGGGKARWLTPGISGASFDPE